MRELQNFSDVCLVGEAGQCDISRHCWGDAEEAGTSDADFREPVLLIRSDGVEWFVGSILGSGTEAGL